MNQPKQGTGCEWRSNPDGRPERAAGPAPYGDLVEFLFEQSRPADSPILCHHLGAFDHEGEAGPRWG
jgi:hypothetical protein